MRPEQQENDRGDEVRPPDEAEDPVPACVDRKGGQGENAVAIPALVGRDKKGQRDETDYAKDR